VHLDERVDEPFAHRRRSSGLSRSAGISLVTTWPSTLSMTKNGAPMTCSSSQTARIPGTRAWPRRAPMTRASRSTSCALGGSGPRGGRRSTTSASPRVTTNVTLEWPSPTGCASMGPEPIPLASRNASSGSVTSSGSRSFCAPSSWVRTMSSGAIVCTTDRPRPGASTRPASRA
jgi:hypothetical protein